MTTAGLCRPGDGWGSCTATSRSSAPSWRAWPSRWSTGCSPAGRARDHRVGAGATEELVAGVTGASAAHAPRGRGRRPSTAASRATRCCSGWSESRPGWRRPRRAPAPAASSTPRPPRRWRSSTCTRSATCSGTSPAATSTRRAHRPRRPEARRAGDRPGRGHQDGARAPTRTAHRSQGHGLRREDLYSSPVLQPAWGRRAPDRASGRFFAARSAVQGGNANSRTRTSCRSPTRRPRASDFAERPLSRSTRNARRCSRWLVMDAVRLVLDVLPEVARPDPADLRAMRSLLGRSEALRGHPPARDRRGLPGGPAPVRFEEALVLQVALAQRQAAIGRHGRPPRRPRAGGLLEAFDARLPFELTAGQRAVGGEIADDLAQDAPDAPAAAGRGRLGQDRRRAAGDAGGRRRGRAGRPARADRGARRPAPPVDHRDARRRWPSGACSAAPRRHRGSRCSPARSRPPRAARRCSTPSAATRASSIGTHALLQENVEFADLGLVVVDEQHRFGVEQRDALRGKGEIAPARAGHDRDADPAHGRDDRLRRPRDVDAARAARRARADQDPRRAAPAHPTLGAARLGAGPRGGRGRAPGVRRLPADRRRTTRARPTGSAPTPTRAPSTTSPTFPPGPSLEVLEELLADPALAGLRIELLHGRLPAEEKDAR